MFEAVVSNIEAAISNGRTDVILTLVDNCKSTSSSNADNNGKASLPLSSILNSSLTSTGTFLHLATKLNQSDIVRCLLLSGADPTIRNSAGQTAVALAVTPQMAIVYDQELMRTVAASDVRRVQLLLTAGVNVNCQEGSHTPLHWAVSYANVETVSFLLDKGAEVNALNCFGASPLHDAVIRADASIVQKLLDCGANISSKGTHGKFENESPLSLANSNPKILTILQDHSLRQSPDIDLEQISDTSSSWANECGSRESLITFVASEEVHPKSMHSSNESTSNENQLIEAKDSATKVYSLPNAAHNFSAELKMLWPTPQHVELTDRTTTFQSTLRVYCIEGRQLGDVHQVMKLWQVHEKRLLALGIAVQFEGTLRTDSHHAIDNGIICHVQDSLFPNHFDSYRLFVNEHKIQMVAGDLRGLFYATSLLVQLLVVFSKRRILPVMKVFDWPDWHCRGVLLKISPNRPSLNMVTIHSVLSTAAYLRINYLFLELQLTDRQALKLPNSLSNSGIIALDSLCKDWSVTLTPAVELDETLVPTITLLDVNLLLSRYLICFTSKRYLYAGPHLTKFLLNLTKENGFFPVLTIPEETCLILDWTYIGDHEFAIDHVPFNATLLIQCQRPWNNQELTNYQKKSFQKGLSQSVMLRCSLGNSLMGYPTSIYDAWQQVCCSGGGKGSTAIILDLSTSEKYGVLPLFQLSGLFSSAGLTWNASRNWANMEAILPDLLDSHVFGGNKFGEALAKLAIVEETFGGSVSIDGCTFPYQLMTRPDTVSLDGLTAEKLQKIVREIKISLAAIAKINPDDVNSLHVIEEIYFISDVLIFCYRYRKEGPPARKAGDRMCRTLVSVGQNPSRATGLAMINVGISNLPPTCKTDLANRLLELKQRFQKIWLTYNLHEGFHVVLRTFHVLLHQLIPQVSSDSIIEI